MQGCCKVVAGGPVRRYLVGYMGTWVCSLGPDESAGSAVCSVRPRRYAIGPEGVWGGEISKKYGCLIHHLQAAVKLGTGICLGLVQAAPPTLSPPVSVRATASRREDTQEGPLVLH